MANEDLVPIKEIVQNLIGSHVDGLRSGMRYGEQKFHPALRALETQYRSAQADEAARVPTALSVAIEAVLKLLPAQDAKPDWIDRPDVDMDTFGHPLRPGS